MKPYPSLSRFERSPITQALADRLRETAVGETADYAGLSMIAGGDVQREARHLLASARDILLRERGIATDALTNVGIKRLTPDGVVSVSDGLVRRHRSLARKGMRVLGTVSPEALPADRRQRYFLNRIRLGLLHLMTGRRVERQLVEAGESLSLADVRKRVVGLFGKVPP